ncbi:MAG: ABC transporter permease [Gordonia sp. (in: high G+C Gram-positive bacteria)]
MLTTRGLLKVFRNGEFIFAFVSPALLAICFYLPLREAVAQVATIDYAQYLMPVIMLQSAAFVASSASMRAAVDGQEGVHTRFRVMPMPTAVPFLARAATNFVLLLVALACGLITCLIMGWRPVPEEYGGGVTGAAIAVLLVAMIGMALTLCADGIGLVAKSPEATSQLVAFPTLILGMLSTGFIPLNQFPEWIQGFVEYQPISQVTKAMRDAIGGILDWQRFEPTLWWTLGLFAVAAVLLVLGTRKAAR